MTKAMAKTSLGGDGKANLNPGDFWQKHPNLWKKVAASQQATANATKLKYLRPFVVRWPKVIEQRKPTGNTPVPGQKPVAAQVQKPASSAAKTPAVAKPTGRTPAVNTLPARR